MGKFWIDDMVADRAKEIGASALAVYVQLARWAGKDGCVSRQHCSLRALREATGLSRPWVVASIRRLEALGVLITERSTKVAITGRVVNSVNHYRLTQLTTVGNSVNHPWLTQATEVGNSVDHPFPYKGEESGEVEREESPRTRAGRIPVGWDPTAEDRSEAGRILDGTGLDIDATAEAFRDYYQASGTTRVDWSAAWRSWCRREVGYAAARPGRNGNGHGGGMNGSLAERAAIIEQQLRGKGLCDDG